MSPWAVTTLLTRTTREFLKVKGTQHAAALAFYAMFSLAPVLVLVTSVVAALYGHEVAHQELYIQLQTVLTPEAASWLDQLVADAAAPGSGWFATATSMAVMLFAATGAFLQLQASLNAIWSIEPRPAGFIVALLWKRVASFFLVGALGLLMIGTIGSMVVMSWAVDFLPIHVDVQTIFLVERVLNYGVMTCMLALAYKVLPDAKVAWRDVFFAAVFSAAMLGLGKQAIHLYMERQGFSSIFGAASSLVVVMVFIYYASIIILFGAELTQERAAQRGEPIQPAWYAAHVRVELHLDLPGTERPPPLFRRMQLWVTSRRERGQAWLQAKLGREESPESEEP